MAISVVLVVEGYELTGTSWTGDLAIAIWLFAAAVSTFHQVVEVLRTPQKFRRIREQLLDWLLLLIVLALVLLNRRGLLALVVFFRQGIAVIRVFLSTHKGHGWIASLLAQPAKLLAVSFLSVILCGMVFLTFPRATVDGRGATAINALFTATSATCVTGLTVVPTQDANAASGSSFSLYGQVAILLLIQVGGLGIMTLSAAIMLLLGQRLSAGSQAAFRNVLGEESRQSIEQSVTTIFTMTLIIEAIGALLLFQRFLGTMDDMGMAAWYALFHAISAYCNAGFSLFGDSLVSFRGDTTVMLTVMALVTLGGLGPAVVAAVFHSSSITSSPEITWRRWPLHVRVVLTMSCTLFFLGFITFYFLEFNESMGSLSFSEKLTAAAFQSVSFRTAGFHTVDLSQIHRVTLVVVVMLMVVGGSPGSTAGGVKTSTIAVVFLGVRAMLLGRDEVEVSGRTIAKEVVYKAISILAVFVTILVLGFLLLLAAEPDHDFEVLFFETVSAVATVGVSMGVTSKLTVLGKLIVTFLMFAGRIGPLTMALAVGDRGGPIALRYPEGNIVVG